MDFSTDDKHRATLDMLRETLEYLERLPPVPLTKQFCGRLRAHLDEPNQRLVASGRRELHGVGPFTLVGLPLLEASVVDEVLTVELPRAADAASREEILKQLMLAIAKGPIRVGLRARNLDPAG